MSSTVHYSTGIFFVMACGPLAESMKGKEPSRELRKHMLRPTACILTCYFCTIQVGRCQTSVEGCISKQMQQIQHLIQKTNGSVQACTEQRYQDFRLRFSI